jgi:tetratricopeptide (TPR) repeat protein
MRTAITALALLTLLAGTTVRAQDVEGLAMTANRAMELWDYDTARDALARLEAQAPGAPITRYVTGKYLHHMGEYEEALEALDAGLTAQPDAAPLRDMRDLVASTIEVVEGLDTHVTADGLFEIRYDAARDAALIPWAEETLSAAYYEIGYDVGYWPEPPIRVEIYPHARTLARVSSLTEEAIEASGTIALCKYNKLMFTSPRATLYGYPWRETLAHEYVHYVVGHLTHAELPIWLHEAIAKYLEGRWTGAREPSLGPHREALLTERVADDALVTFEEMHPSMAYLPTPEDASTAYAEVFTVMEYLESRRGSGVIRRLLRELAEGAAVEEAFEAVVGEPFDAFERNWMRYLRARPPVVIPGDFDLEIQLRPESGDDPGLDRWVGVSSVEARDYMRLGELLRARGQTEGAIAEYQKAEHLTGPSNPILQNALARAYLDAGRPDDALAAVEEVARWHPDFYRSHLHRGEAALALDRPEEAVEALLEAGGINPFDPAVHTRLAAAFDALGAATLAARHRSIAGQLGNGAPAP